MTRGDKGITEVSFVSCCSHLNEDALSVGAGDCVHCIKDKVEVLAGKEGLEEVEIKHLL